MIYFLLPAYNEEQSIAKQLRQIGAEMSQQRVPFRIVVVNDGSVDGTKEQINSCTAELPVVVLDHECNKGVGQAFKTGFEWIMAQAADDDIIITMDADRTHNIKSTRMMIQKIREEGYEVAIGSVYATGGMFIGVPFLRYVLSLACNRLYRTLFPVGGIREYTGFFRAYLVAALRVVREKFGDRFIEAAGFGAMAELLIKCRQIPLFITEVPMIVRYDLKGSASKMKVLATIREHLAVILRNLFKRRII